MTERRGILTEFNTTIYRSRLEAKWAYMFDRLGWKYTYEPFDLDGYIPDFCFNGWERPTIVEIKPATSFGELHKNMDKIRASGWQHEVLLLGAIVGDDDYHPQIGIISEHNYSEDRCAHNWNMSDALLFKCSCDCYSIYHQCGDWRCRVHGCWGGDGHLGSVEFDLQTLWRKAGNVVRWKGKKLP